MDKVSKNSAAIQQKIPKQAKRKEAEQSRSKEAARLRQIDGLRLKTELDEAAWRASRQRTSQRARKRRSPIQRNSANYKKLQTILPAAVFESLDLGEFPAPPFWGSLGQPHVVGPVTTTGGRMLQVDGRQIGDSKGQPRPVRCFLRIRPAKKYRSIAWDFATSLRGLRVPRLDVADCLLACTSRRNREAEIVKLPVYRASTGSDLARERAQRYASDALHLFGSGQGPGICSFVHLLLPATVARAKGFNVDLEVVGESDRFVRTGSFVDERILSGAGIGIDCELVDDPYAAKQEDIFKRYRKEAEDLTSVLKRYVCQLALFDETTDLLVGSKFRGLPGLEDSLAVGAGLDWFNSDEAFGLGIDRHILAHFRNHASWRPVSRRSGYWLMQAGFRRRLRIETRLRPILPAGFEKQALQIIALRFPSARFHDPISLPICYESAATSDGNARALAGLQGEELVAVDHAMIHWGSTLDLDVMVRQNKSALRTVFPSSYAAPAASLSVLRDLDAILADARVEAREVLRAL
jgi:hypothetical protein